MGKTIGMLVTAGLVAGLLAGQTGPHPTGLEGVVRNALTGAPVGGVQVLLNGKDDVPAYHVLTDALGRFAFTDVVPGQYKLTGKKNGYVYATFGRPKGDGEPIPLARGDRRTGVELRMTPGGVIAGRALDNNGDPVAGLIFLPARVG